MFRNARISALSTQFIHLINLVCSCDTDTAAKLIPRLLSLSLKKYTSSTPSRQRIQEVPSILHPAPERGAPLSARIPRLLSSTSSCAPEVSCAFPTTPLFLSTPVQPYIQVTFTHSVVYRILSDTLEPTESSPRQATGKPAEARHESNPRRQSHSPRRPIRLRDSSRGYGRTSHPFSQLSSWRPA